MFGTGTVKEGKFQDRFVLPLCCSVVLILWYLNGPNGYLLTK